MNIALPSLARVRGLPGGEDIAAVFMELQAAIVAGWQVNHNPDGQHTTIYSATGVLTALGQLRVRLFKNTTAQTITSGTDTFVTWDANRGSTTSQEEYDPVGLFNGSDGIRITQPGLYLALAMVRWDANGTGSRVLKLYLDNVATETISARALGDATNGPTQQVVCPVYVPPNVVTIVKVRVFQDSGTNRTIGNGSGLSDWFAVIKVS